MFFDTSKPVNYYIGEKEGGDVAEKILSTEDLKRLIDEAVSQRKLEISLHGAHFSNIDFRMAEVPISLDLDGCLIDGDFNLAMAKFGGAYISLDCAEIGGSILLNGMENHLVNGIGLFLRGTTIHGTVELMGTKINTLCVYAADFEKGSGRTDVEGLFRLDRTQINRLFLHPQEGELEDIQRVKEKVRARRLAEAE